MNEIEFDRALSDFLDDEQCERNSEAVYQLIRAAFAAGWRAAGGGSPGADSAVSQAQTVDRGRFQ